MLSNGLELMSYSAHDYRMKLLSEVAKDALELPPNQRLTLARILLDVSEPDQDFSPEVETAWEQEIERRMKAVKSGDARSKSAEQAFAELDRRYPS
jgi:hypothetical protein